MAEIINLRQARKGRAREQAQTLAAVNRAKFGQPRGDAARRRAEAERQARLLDGAKREPE